MKALSLSGFRHRASAQRSAWIAALALAASMTSTVRAQDTGAESLDLGQLSYISGGIGADESAAMKAQASSYSLALIFAQHLDGQDVFLASVPVVISKDDGTSVLDIVTEGPYLLVNLPEGIYRISATYGQREKTANVQIKPGAHERRTFLWEELGSAAVSTTASAPTVVAAAAAPAPSVVVTTPTSHLPAAKTYGNVSYITGGIGSDESNALKAELGKHPLSLTLASRIDGKDVFLASVPVVVRDASGTVVLEATSEGPYLLADLPPGNYDVSASHKGEEKRGSAAISAGKPARLTFLWQGSATP